MTAAKVQKVKPGVFVYRSCHASLGLKARCLQE